MLYTLYVFKANELVLCWLNHLQSGSKYCVCSLAYAHFVSSDRWHAEILPAVPETDLVSIMCRCLLFSSNPVFLPRGEWEPWLVCLLDMMFPTDVSCIWGLRCLLVTGSFRHHFRLFWGLDTCHRKCHAERWANQLQYLSGLMKYHASYHDHPLTCHVSAIQKDTYLSHCSRPACHDRRYSGHYTIHHLCIRG
jgi:hypothetical protein